MLYSHGALHLFDAGSELQKYTLINTGRRLTEQFREALENSHYPLIVAEDDETRTRRRFMHSNISRGYRSLLEISGGLFVHGQPLGENDENVLHLVRRGRTKHLFFSLFGDAHRLKTRRSSRTLST